MYRSQGKRSADDEAGSCCGTRRQRATSRLTDSVNYQRAFQLMYDRPQEPLFIPKGREGVAFDVPPKYMPSRYQNISDDSMTQYRKDAKERIPVAEVDIPPLGDILSLERTENFSLFLPKHQRIAGHAINILYNTPDSSSLLSLAVYLRDRINPLLFNYALTVTLMHRPDTRDIQIPPLFTVFPDKYIDSQALAQAVNISDLNKDSLLEDSGQVVELPLLFTANTQEPEQRVAYFREDIGLNSHHWHWHLVYPFDGPREIVAKDRRGELFYYMHQQVMARYNMERMCNGLGRVRKLSEWQAAIPEAYFPKLSSSVASRAWPARVPNQYWRDVTRQREDVHIDLNEMYRWRDRLFDAIQSGAVRNSQGDTIRVDDDNGIDVFGNLIEASAISPNRDFYGNLHNSGHILFGYIHDPDGRYLESFGVMGDTSTAMRDPVFYRWHAFIDYMFRVLKDYLPPYTVQQLDFKGVTVQKIQVQTDGDKEVNRLATFWQKTETDISSGLDFHAHRPIRIRFTHLQHKPFTYQITVGNGTAKECRGTCRIFLAPALDESNCKWTFREQRPLLAELDKFSVTLKPGINHLKRSSTESTVTIPMERIYQVWRGGSPSSGDKTAWDEFSWCGCGWPHNLLIPKGTTKGYACQLFVMISDFEGDVVKQAGQPTSDDASAFCGIRDKLYPDKRPMGYPFDRVAPDGVRTLQQFLTENMAIADVKIQFSDT